MLHATLLKGTFQDSVTLMLLSRDLSNLPNVKRVSVMMGTPANKDVFRETGLWHETLAAAAPNDLCIVVDSDQADPAVVEGVAEQVHERLAKLAKGGRKALYPAARSWRRVKELLPNANLALISVPGQYAAGVARQALEDGCHAMIFSDNVSIDQELELKTTARERGLLVMGPDCGTAIVGGAPLAFANRIPSGPIGVVGASGTGIQEITSQIARLGGGISHALGLGGRDLSERIGGISAITALDFVARDEGTRIITFVSKPPAATVKDRILATMRKLGKPVVALFLGDKPSRRDLGNVHLARTLDEAAALAVELAEIETLASAIGGAAGRGICGLYAGGTLANEAAQLLSEALDLSPDADHVDGYMLHTGDHRIIDLGDDVYTRGRPHPMIDPFTRNQMIGELASDPKVGVLLVDVVLGFGAQADPAGEVARAVADMKAKRGKNAPIAVIATLTGTPEDPQNRDKQAQALEEAGIIIASSVRAAVLLAVRAVVGESESSGQQPSLLSAAPEVINIGLKGFADDLHGNGTKVVQYQWEPVTEGSERLRALAASLL